MTTAVISGHWTYDEYYNLDDKQRYEVIEGDGLLWHLCRPLNIRK